MLSSSFSFSNSQHLYLVSGPCAVESYDQMKKILSAPNAPTLLRGGVYKMRTQKNSFQGLGKDGYELIQQLKKEFQFDFITEVTDPRHIENLMPFTSIFQVGARNMYNYELLKELAIHKKPVILKRSFSATITEWLGAAEYLSPIGEENIILCERGVRSFDTKLRNMLDLGSVIYLKKNTKFKIFVDPSHSMGLTPYVADAAYAAVAAGADGLMVEVHPDPSSALSDGQQALNLDMYQELVLKLQKLAPLFDKTLKV